MKRDAYLFGKRPRGNIVMGLSLASTWAWGVSIIVGVQVVQGKGLLAYLIWAAANAAALTLFGCMTKSVTVRKTVTDIMPRMLKPIYHYFTLLIQFFSVLVNLTAIQVACTMLGYPQASVLVSLALFLIVFFKGFDANLKGDIGFILVWIAVLTGVVAVMPKSDLVVAVSTGCDILWAVWGAVILLCGPLVDQQMWQRRISMQDHSVRPFAIGSTVFAFYMVLVGLLGIYGADYPLAVAVIIICVAGSTLQSALSAVSCYSRTTNRGRVLMAGCFLFAYGCLAFGLPVLSIWLIYGSLRVIPALYVGWRCLNGRK